MEKKITFVVFEFDMNMKCCVSTNQQQTLLIYRFIKIHEQGKTSGMRSHANTCKQQAFCCTQHRQEDDDQLYLQNCELDSGILLHAVLSLSLTFLL